MNKRIVLVALALILVSILLVGTPPARNILRQGAVALLALVPTYISSPVATSTYTTTPTTLPSSATLKVSSLKFINTTAAFGLTRSWPSCSPSDTSKVYVRTIQYKIAGAAGHPLYVLAYLPNTSPYVGGTKTDLPAVVLFHGGGLHSGDPYSYFGNLGPRIASKNIAVFAFQYRITDLQGASTMALESIQDGISALKWLKIHASKFGVDASNIASIGMSAGGQLAFMAGLRSEDTPSLGIYDDDGVALNYSMEGMTGFYPRTDYSNHQKRFPYFVGASPTDYFNNLVTAGRSPTVPIAIHLGGGDIYNNYINPNAIVFCDAMNSYSSGTCAIDTTPFAPHNFAGARTSHCQDDTHPDCVSGNYYPQALQLVADDLTAYFGRTISFSSDVTASSAPPVCWNTPSSTVNDEAVKWKSFFCNMPRYSSSKFCVPDTP